MADPTNEPTSCPSIGTSPSASGAGVSRRAIVSMISAIAAAPAIAFPAAEARAESVAVDHADDPYANGVAVAYLDVASSWLSQWTALGGTVVIDGRDKSKALIGQPAFDLSPEYAAYEKYARECSDYDWFKKLSLREQENQLRQHRSFLRDRFEGKMYALYKLLSDLPDVLRMVKELVAIEPRAGFPVTCGEA